MQIGSRIIGEGEPVYIVAELSANHRGDFELACELVVAAKQAGADAVKVQTFTPGGATLDSDAPPFRVGDGTLWSGRKLYDLYTEAMMPWSWQPKLQAHAHKLGIEFFSMGSEPGAIDFLEGMDVPVHKVSSFEIVDIPLVEKAARTGKPLILSTGMASLEEIEEAVGAARSAGCRQLALLKCTSAYPAPPEEMNLRTIPELARRFGVPVGLSDHTMGIAVPVAAVALGASIIEKHFTLRRSDGGLDAAFSLEPHEFREMVQAIRAAEKSLGSVRFGGGPEEAKSRVFRRSLFVVGDVKRGQEFTGVNVRSIRPAHGLHPRHLPDVLGRHAACDIEAGTPLSWELVAGGTPAAAVRHGAAEKA